MANNTIILRNVYGKVGQVYYISPCKDPKTGRYPSHVKPVDSNGNIIWTDAERNDTSTHYIKETEVFKIEDGSTFNLDDKVERAIWEAIKNCSYIAPSRFAKDASGNNLIDGTMGWKSDNPRYGIADFYVYEPEEETNKRISKKDTLRKALNFIYDDPKGAQGRVLICRLLGRNMSNVSDNEVKEFLVMYAEKDPDKIIKLYTGDDTQLRLFLLEAKDRRIIYIKDKLYMYGDNIVLGATEDAALTWLRDPKNRKLVELIRKDTYPELYEDIKGKDK